MTEAEYRQLTSGEHSHQPKDIPKRPGKGCMARKKAIDLDEIASEL